jgi:hypothetical protein
VGCPPCPCLAWASHPPLGRTRTAWTMTWITTKVPVTCHWETRGRALGRRGRRAAKVAGPRGRVVRRRVASGGRSCQAVWVLVPQGCRTLLRAVLGGLARSMRRLP